MPDLSCSQLFLDDTWIDDCLRVERVWHPARKYPEPVLVAEHPWEWNCPVAYGTVLRRDGRFQMWYAGWTRHHPAVICYAESADGVHWEKPSLGLLEVDGTKTNNVVLVSDDPGGASVIDDISVIDDPDDTAWPLKALYWDGYCGNGGREPFGIYVARSRDGIRWEKLGKVLPGWGDRFNALSTRHDGTYVLYGRAPEMHTSRRGRIVYRTTSDDLLHWSQPELVMTPDADDPVNLEFYSASVFPYGDLLMAGIERMHMTPDKLDVEIAWSRDGHRWQRSGRRPSFIEWGVPGRWDSTWINLTSNAPIVVDNHLWFYYSGRSGAHNSPFPHNHGAIGLATLRADGFCSLRAAEQQGWILTPPLTWPGGDLQVNVDTRRYISGHPRNILSGELAVDILTAERVPVEGYAAQDMESIRQNTIGGCVPVTWRDRSLDALAGTDIRLRFNLRDAHLFAFKAG